MPLSRTTSTFYSRAFTTLFFRSAASHLKPQSLVQSHPGPVGGDYSHHVYQPVHAALFSTEATAQQPKVENGKNPSEVVQELYKKILKSVEARTAPPNAWLWSLFQSCANREDLTLLFQVLQRLRIFRLSNLRIHDNYNHQYCMKVAEACARAGALDLGHKVLWKHNVYGLTPTVGSAHYLLRHAKEQKDVKAMLKILNVMKRNSLHFQPSTADIVFSICYDTKRWDLLCKIAKKFIESGVKLHSTAFDIWMEFAAEIGNSQAIWEIEELRSGTARAHSPISAFACAKGYLLDQKPEDAATIIIQLYKDLPETSNPQIERELERLVKDWTAKVSKKIRKEDTESLRSNVSILLSQLKSSGVLE